MIFRMLFHLRPIKNVWLKFFLAHIHSDIDWWIKERNTNNDNEFDDENILYIQGNWEIDNLDLDNIFNQTDEPEHIFTIQISCDVNFLSAHNHIVYGNITKYCYTCAAICVFVKYIFGG